MKNNIIKIAVATIALLLVSCGSNTKVDPIGNQVTPAPGGGNSGSSKAGYRFTNATSINISSSEEEREVTIDLIDKHGSGVSGKTIKVSVLPIDFGSFMNTVATTNSAGRAKFAYVAPRKIEKINKLSKDIRFVFTDDHNSTISTMASITFNKDNGAETGNTELPIVVIPNDKKNVVLDKNSKSYEVKINVFKSGAPFTEGKVKVMLPTKILNGVDVGQFDKYESEISSTGVATFIYTGPSNLKALIAQGETGSLFNFYHEANPKVKKGMSVTYQSPEEEIIPVNYSLITTTNNGKFSMGIPNTKKNFTVALNATNSSGGAIAITTERITKVTVQTKNSKIAQLLDGSTLKDTVELTTTDSQVSFVLKSKTLSGLVPVEITVDYIDVNNKVSVLKSVINVRVFSGPPSAVSISYASTGQDATRAKYIERLAISVTDEYGNRVNTQPNISIGAIAGYAVDGKEVNGVETNETKRLFYGRSDIVNGIANGKLEKLPGGNNANFEDTTASRANVFRYVNAEGDTSDKLILLGQRKNYEAMGKWDIDTKLDNHTLSLKDDYYGISRVGLYYAVGHNYYQDLCREDGREWIGATDADSYKLDEEGTVVINYTYDYHLTGKDVLVWVNLYGSQPDTGEKTRIGEAVKHTLRGHGFTSVPSDGYTLDKGASGYARFDIWHKDASEHYRNGHFGSRVKSNCLVVRYVVSSNNYDARTCRVSFLDGLNTIRATNGNAFVTYYVEAAADAGCSINLVENSTTVSGEF